MKEVIRAEINEIENRKTKEKKKEPVFKKINKMDNPLARLVKKTEEETSYRYHKYNKSYLGYHYRHYRCQKDKKGPGQFGSVRWSTVLKTERSWV